MFLACPPITKTLYYFHTSGRNFIADRLLLVKIVTARKEQSGQYREEKKSQKEEPDRTVRKGEPGKESEYR